MSVIYNLLRQLDIDHIYQGLYLGSADALKYPADLQEAQISVIITVSNIAPPILGVSKQ